MGNDGTVFNGGSRPQSANRKTSAVESDQSEAFTVTPGTEVRVCYLPPSTVNEPLRASKGAINKQTLARLLIANDRLFVCRFPSGSQCSADRIRRRQGERLLLYQYVCRHPRDVPHIGVIKSRRRE